jgi:DNA-binding PadR family transcriptional regulator
MHAHEYLPLSETSLLIMLSLTKIPKHGYGIMKDVEEMSAGRVQMATGTLYSALRRMLDEGWIERMKDGQPKQNIRERKFYQLTILGRRILALEMERLQTLVQLSQVRIVSE